MNLFIMTEILIMKYKDKKSLVVNLLELILMKKILMKEKLYLKYTETLKSQQNIFWLAIFQKDY